MCLPCLLFQKGRNLKALEMEAHEVSPDVVDVLPTNVMKVSFT